MAPRLRRTIQTLNKRRRAIAAIVCTLVILALLIASNFPAQQVFEGNLQIEELSFVYSAEQAEAELLLLNAIRGLSAIELSGSRKLSLIGQLEINNGGEGASPLTNNEALEVEFLDDNSRIILQSQSRQLELQALTIAPQTTIGQLTYLPRQQQLALTLQPDEQTSQLDLSLGIDPIQVILEGVCLNACDRPDADPQDYLELTWTPTVSDLSITISEPSELFFSIPDPATVDTQEWITGDIPVSKIQFSRFVATTSDAGWELSTILDGTLRMGDRTLELDPHQFLLTSQPGIEKIRQLQLLSDTEPARLQARISGRAQQVKIGVDRLLPVQTLEVKLLDKYLSRDTIGALFSFCGAVLGYLLTWLFTQNNRD